MVSRTAGFRRRGMALAMLAGPVFFVLANAAGAWETRDGGDDMTGSAALALAAAHPGLERASMVTGMLGCLLMVPAVLGAMRLVEQRAAGRRTDGVDRVRLLLRDAERRPVHARCCWCSVSAPPASACGARPHRLRR